MDPTLPEQASSHARRSNPRNQRLLVPAVMATLMSLVMSLVQTIIRIGFAPNLLPTWLTSFAIGVVVAAPTAMLVAPSAQRLVGYLTGGPRR
jgi:integral membrane sensor domain MASE1